MIKMNQKFRQKIKEEVKLLDDQLGMFNPANSAASFNPVSTTTLKLITNIIANNKGLLKITPNLYMNDDVMYYINDERKEYYSITKLEYLPRLEHILYVSVLEIGLKLFPISYLDQEFTKKIQNFNWENSKLEKKKVINVKNDIWTDLRISAKYEFYKYIVSDERKNLNEEKFQDMIANITEIFLSKNTNYLNIVKTEDTQSATDIGGLFYIFTYRYFAQYISLLMYIYNEINAEYCSFSKESLMALYYHVTMSPKCLSIIDNIVEYNDTDDNSYNDTILHDFERSLQLIITQLLNKTDSGIEYFQRLFADAQYYMNCEFNNKKFLSSTDIAHVLPIHIFDRIIVDKISDNDYNVGSAFYTYYMYAPEYKTILPISNDPLYENEMYTKFISSKLKHDIFCSFLSDKWKEPFYDKMNKMAKMHFSKKDIDLLVKSFKHVAFLIPSTYSLSSTMFLEYLGDFSMTVLDPDLSEDEELFNRFFFDVQHFYPSQETFNLVYNEQYSTFHSKKGLFVFVNRSGARFLINLYDEQGALSQPVMSYGINPKHNSSIEDMRHLISFASMSGNYYNDILNINNDNYKSNHTQKHQVGEAIYFIFSLIDYLKQKQQDGSIELKIVETEEKYDKKRKTSTFTVHERKSSWVRAHYRHYKSGLVTLVMAHSRKGTNVVNDRLVLNL